MIKFNHYPSLIQLMVGSICQVINQITIRSNSNPKVINGYSLTKSLSKHDIAKSVTYGIYQKKNKYYFIKTWHGGLKDLSYYYLMSQYLISKKLTQRFSNKYRIKFPKLIETVGSNSKFSLIYEFISGRSLSEYSTTTQAKVIAKIINIFSKINISDVYIPSRPATSYLFILPFITISLLISHPSKFIVIFNTFWRCFLGLINQIGKPLVLSHRDLTPDNIVVKKNTIFILDWENLAATLARYDISFINMFNQFDDLSRILSSKYNLNPSPTLRRYLAFHHSIGSGNFLSIQNSLFNQLSNKSI